VYSSDLKLSRKFWVVTVPVLFSPIPEIRTYFQKSVSIPEALVEPKYDDPKISEVVKIAYPSGFYYIPEDLHKTIWIHFSRHKIRQYYSYSELRWFFKNRVLKVKNFHSRESDVLESRSVHGKDFFNTVCSSLLLIQRLSDGMVQCHLVSKLWALMVYPILPECS